MYFYIFLILFLCYFMRFQMAKIREPMQPSGTKNWKDKFQHLFNIEFKHM